MICTFYSYKGGVGRSMALANVGEWLYLQGLRVVMVDWDLEAPGLESFFATEEPTAGAYDHLGLVDLLLDYKEDLVYLPVPRDGSVEAVVAVLEENLQPLRAHLHPIRPPTRKGDRESALWILPAGWRSGERRFEAYAHAVQGFDWREFYERYLGEAYFEWLRRQLLSEDLADIVLIDSRTGLTEMGGVATRQLADVVVCFCVPNLQNLDGVAKLARSFKRRDVEERRGRPLDVLVVPTRIENSELDARKQFQREFRKAVYDLTPEQMRRAGRTFWDLRIPYIPKYAYRELLAVGAADGAEELVAAYDALARQLLDLAPEGTPLRQAVEQKREPKTKAVGAPRVTNLAPRNPLVVGRKPLVNQIHRRLAAERVPLVLCGLGGVGKSTLALEYAHRFSADYDVVWWVDAENPDGLASGYAELARRIGVGQDDRGQAVDAVRQWLSAHTGWLLILDGASTPGTVRGVVPSDVRGDVLITSRSPAWQRLAGTLEVPVLARAASVELLRRRTGDSDEPAAHALAEALGDLPLALEQAGAYVEATRRSLTEYLELFRRRGAELLTRVSPTSVSTVSVAAAWDMSLQELREEHPASLTLLNFAAVLAPRDIPLDRLGQAAADLGDHGDAALVSLLQDPIALDEAVGALRLYSLAQPGDAGLTVHRLVQAVTREALEDGELQRLVQLAVQLIWRALPRKVDDVEAWPDVEQLLPHARAVLARVDDRGKPSDAVVGLLADLGMYLEARGDLAGARALLERAVTAAEGAWDSRHPVMSKLLSELASALFASGDVDAARSALERALQHAYQSESAPVVARVLTDLGVVRLHQRDLEGAEDATRRALEVAESDRGTTSVDAGDTARLLANLAIVLARSGRPEDALDAGERALALADTEGPRRELPDLLLQLAAVREEQGDLDGADRDRGRALELLREEAGPTHPKVAEALTEMGSAELRRGAPGRAAELLREALALGQSVLGPEHPTVARTAALLASALRELGEEDEAAVLSERATTAVEKAYGTNVPPSGGAGLGLFAPETTQALQPAAPSATRPASPA